jgi:hypothetical protein
MIANALAKETTTHQTVKEKDVKAKAVLAILVIAMVTLAACDSGTPTEAPAAPTAVMSDTSTQPTAEPVDEADTEVGDTAPTDSPAEPTAEPAGGETLTATTLDEDYPDASPVFMQLVVGTMMLEETPYGVTAEQAQDLLVLWQMFRAIRRGEAPPSLEEIDAVTEQIMAAMTPEQLGAIQAMQITQDTVRSFTQDNNIPQGQGSGPGGGDTQGLSDEERRMRMITIGGKNLVDELIRRLEMWAG